MSEGKWVLQHGIHRGTIISRDSAESEYDTREEAIRAFLENKRRHASWGYVIWFAYLISPEGVKEVLDAGSCPYR